MADDTAADAKTGDGSQKKKKKKRKKKESETAPKHLKKKKKKVRRNAAEAGLQPSRRIPSHPTAFPPHRCKNAYFLTLAFSLSRVLVVAHRLSRPRTRLTILHLPCHLTDFSRSGLPKMLPGEISIKRAHRQFRRIYWCFTASFWQARWPSSSRKIHQRGAKCGCGAGWTTHIFMIG